MRSRTERMPPTKTRLSLQQTHRELGRIDLLLNMASIHLSTPEPKETDCSNIIDANSCSAFLFSIHAGPMMKLGESGGRILKRASDWSWRLLSETEGDR